MQVTSTQLNVNTQRDDLGELSRFFVLLGILLRTFFFLHHYKPNTHWEMKTLRVLLLSLVFVCIGSKVFADSLVINYSNSKKL